MSHTGLFFLAVLIAVVGLAIRLLLMGTSAARLGFLPEKWQRWFLNGTSHPAQRK